MNYVTVQDVLNQLPNVVQPDAGMVQSYIDDAEAKAVRRIGTPLPPGNTELANAIIDHAVGAALEKAYRAQSRDLFVSARELQNDAIATMEEINADTLSEGTEDAHIVRVERLRF